jgi:hypothetical protein
VSGSARIALTVVAVLAAVAPRASAAAPAVETMVAGRTAVLAPVAQARAAAATVRVGGRSCRVAAGTPLAALAAVRRAGGPAFRLRDYGSCSRRARDAASLFVTRIGPDANRGQDGWVYKVGPRVGSGGAGDVTGPFGTRRLLRTGDRLLWFWCVSGAGGCQRTLAVSAPRTVAPGGSLAVRVRGFDDRGRGVVVAGATVTAGGRTATTGADGAAILPGPWSGTVSVEATRRGLAPSFPEEVLAG